MNKNLKKELFGEFRAAAVKLEDAEAAAKKDFLKVMEQFLSGDSSIQQLASLKARYLRASNLWLSATCRFEDPKDHGFDPYGGALDIYLDGEFAFGLFQDTSEIPIAVYSFDRKDKALDVLQIQGEQAFPRGMSAIGRWDRYGLGVVEAFASWAPGIETVMLRPVAENPWYRKYKSGSGAIRSGLARYDSTAKRSGYAYDISLKRYIKSLA